MSDNIKGLTLYELNEKLLEQIGCYVHTRLRSEMWHKMAVDNPSTRELHLSVLNLSIGKNGFIY